VVQDALANFIEILPVIPSQQLAKRTDELLVIFMETLRIAMSEYDIDKEEDYNRILVCNNGCWAIGEIALALPDQVRKYMIDIINILADILNKDIIQ